MTTTELSITFIIFLSSFIFCLIPKIITRFEKLVKIYPLITLVSAGFLLAVLLLDFIPHTLHDNSHGHSHHDSHNAITAGMISCGLSLLCLIGVDQCIINHDHCEQSNDLLEEHDCENQNAGQNHEGQINRTIISDDIGCCNTKILKNTRSKTQALIYISSISIHSFFEGLAIRKNSHIGSFEMGIIAHKILESFAIGVTLFNSALSFNTCLFLNLFYSSLTPFGIAISAWYSKTNYTIREIPLSAFFNGLSLGALMFVVFMEMIPGAFHKKGNKIYKMLSLIIGFILSSFVIIKTHAH